LFDFKNLKTTGQLDPEGDKAFDEETFVQAPSVKTTGVLDELLHATAKRNAWSD
jgi:hypothetical protein